MTQMKSSLLSIFFSAWQSIVKHKLKFVCRVFQFTPRLLLPMQQNTTTPSKNNQTMAWLFKHQMATNSY